MSVCKLFHVSGRVQGVWYRAATQQTAQELGITGYAKNIPDGQVEILACGPAKAIAALEEWLWTGPPQAEVAAVEKEETNPATLPNRFDTA